MKEITPEGFQRAAKELGVEVAIIKTVAEVESAGSGFTDDGNVRILFERHKFHHFTGGDYDQTHPDISNPKAGGYGPGGKHQYERFSEAFTLDPDAAMKSASWGKFQIMGFNFKAAGFDSVGDFVDAMKTGEDAQLAAFVKVIKSWGLKDELRKHNWASFAKQYNGADYKINRYDEKLARAYEKFKHEPEPMGDKPEPAKTEPARDDGTQTDTPASGATKEPDAKEVKISTISPTTKTISFGLIASAVFGFLKEMWTSSRKEVISAGQYAAEHLPMVLLVLGLAALGIWVYNQSAKRAADRTRQIVDITADKGKNDVVIT